MTGTKNSDQPAKVKRKEKKRDVKNSQPSMDNCDWEEGEEKEERAERGREAEREISQNKPSLPQLTSHLISRPNCYGAFSLLPSAGGVYREDWPASRMAVNNKP